MRQNYFGAVENTFALQSLAGGIRARRAHPDQARRQLLEEPQHVSPTQLPADDRTAVRFSAMDLKCLLGQIQTDGEKPDIRHLQHRSGLAVHQVCLHKHVEGRWHPHLDGWSWPLDGQRLHRAAMAID